VLRILHSRSVAEAGTGAAVAVLMEEAEAASTVAVVEAADSMEVVAERIAAEAVVRTAAARRVTLLAAWVPMDAGAAACTAAARVRMAATAVDDHPAPMAERVRME
jgi:hypothetical protein